MLLSKEFITPYSCGNNQAAKHQNRITEYVTVKDAFHFCVKWPPVKNVSSFLFLDGLTVFCDIATEGELFMGQGDYQFEIYRLMKKENK